MSRDSRSTGSRFVVGVETLILRRSMTGVGNYLFNIIRALIEDQPDLELRGLGYITWQKLGHEFIAEIIHEQQEKAPADATVSNALDSRRIRGLAHQQLASVAFFRRMYHSTRPLQFAISSRLQSLDLFHAFNYVPPADPGVPVLPVIYDLSFVRIPEAHPPDRLRQMQTLAKTVARAEQIHTISEFSRKEIAAVYGYPAEKIFVAPPAASAIFRPLGLDTTAHEIARFGLTPGAYFMAVGTLEPRKNLRTLIAAYSRLPSAYREEVPLVIVGGAGWGDLALPSMTDQMIGSGQLRFLRNVRNAELRGLYEGARLMLFPSIYEGFGMPVVEAFACGTAVAHSAETAMDEVSGTQGIRVAAMDTDGWTTTMIDAMEVDDRSNPAARNERINHARMFDWRDSAAIVEQAYQKFR